jgi:hypothetical protein
VNTRPGEVGEERKLLPRIFFFEIIIILNLLNLLDDRKTGWEAGETGRQQTDRNTDTHTYIHTDRKGGVN